MVACYWPLRHTSFPFQWLLVFTLMTGESMAIHLPSEVILPVGGWLVVREHDLGVSGVIGLSVVAAAGNTLGATALYLAGRHGGRPLVRRFGRYVLVHESDIDAAARRMEGNAGRAVFISRLLPVVRTYASFVAGMLDVPHGLFALSTFAGSFVWCLAFVAAGALLGQHWSEIRTPAEVVGVFVLTLSVATVIALTIRTFQR